jgi:hypothetical protein
VHSDPNQLVAGDLLYVPDETSPLPFYACGQENHYRARIPYAEVVVELHDESGAPLRATAYRVVGAGVDLSGRTDGAGVLRCRVPVSTRMVTVSLLASGAMLEWWVGDLDPIDTDAGVRQRLTNLGFLHPEPDVLEDDVTASAIRWFQRAESLEVTGMIDTATRERLGVRYLQVRNGRTS